YRVDVVLEAFARVKAAVPAATLIVAGCGSEERRLRRLAGTLEGDSVRFVGRIDPERMPAVYADADVFVNASVVDNQPVSIIEAPSAGLRVVSTPPGDIRFMPRDGDAGVLVPPDNPPAMAAALLGLCHDPSRARRLALRARHEAARYTWPAVRDRWAEAY